MNLGNNTPPGSIQFVTGPIAGKTISITKASITLGRDPHNDIVIADPSISRQHIQIEWSQGGWIIKKLASQNHVFLNQKEIQQSPLANRDTVGLGQGVTFIFQTQESLQPALQAMQQSAVPQPMAPTPQTPRPFVPNMPTPPPFVPNMPTPSPFVPNMPTPPLAPPVQNDSLTTGTQMAPPQNIPGVPSLEVSTNTDHSRNIHYLTPDRQVFDIGRDPHNTIVINRPTVSSFHAQIMQEGSQLVLIHPHPQRDRTLNGLTIQGQKIDGTQQVRHILTHGDVIRISDESGTFVSLVYNDGSGKDQNQLPELRPIPLGAPVITLGRAPDNMAVLQHPQVSGHHARLEQIPGGYRVVDLNSTNHVYVNAQRVSVQALTPGDIIRIGPFKLTYTGTVLTQQDESNGIRIDALNLKKEGNNHVILLNDITFSIPPRKFVALVGGSGAGKSTLMDALNGLRPAQQGTVLYNGQDYYHNLAAFSTQLGYVPQDDIIHRDLSVERALYFAAKLRLPEDFSEEQIQERINEVLEDVEMKHRRGLLVSKLSGGQRKRVSIALELLAKPSVFFLDEPTSGLDPGLDRKMMLLLRKLADKGHTIILVTHATNNINACDYICFLGQGGRVAYFGPPEEAKTYFGKTDFAEIYSQLEPTDSNPNIPQEAEVRFRQSPQYQQYVVQPLQRGPAQNARAHMPVEAIKPPKRGNAWKQFFLLSRRYLELILNDRVNLAILVLQAPIIGLLLLAMTGNNIFSKDLVVQCAPIHNVPGLKPSPHCQDLINFLNGPNGTQFAILQNKSKNEILQDDILPTTGGDAQKILFIMAFAAIMFGCINGSREIVKENAIYKRERAVNLGIMPYLFSKMAVLGAFSLIQSLILVGLVSIKAPFESSVLLPPFLEIYVTMALTALAGLMTGLMISSLVPNNDRAMSIVPLPLIPQVVFAGVIFSLDKPPFMQILGAFFSTRWAMAAMGTTIGLHGDKLYADGFSYVSTVYTTVTGSSNEAAAASHLLLCWGFLVAMIVIQTIIIAWSLKRKDVRR